MYEVRLCIAGEWRGVTVDDYVPCMPGQRGRPAFTRNAAAGELTCDGWMSYNPVHGSNPKQHGPIALALTRRAVGGFAREVLREASRQAA